LAGGRGDPGGDDGAVGWGEGAAGEVFYQGELFLLDLAREELVFQEAELEAAAFLERERVGEVGEQEGAGGRILLLGVQGAFLLMGSLGCFPEGASGIQHMTMARDRMGSMRDYVLRGPSTASGAKNAPDFAQDDPHSLCD
jgi:hypothetical protein